MTASGRPGFNELKAASQDAGSRVVRAAQALFSQGKKGYLGVSREKGAGSGADEQDGSPAGFVGVVLEQAHVQRGEAGQWGQVVFEQEGGSVLKKLDDVSVCEWARERC
jgi:hypothetical protein